METKISLLENQIERLTNQIDEYKRQVTKLKENEKVYFHVQGIKKGTKNLLHY